MYLQAWSHFAFTAWLAAIGLTSPEHRNISVLFSMASSAALLL